MQKIMAGTQHVEAKFYFLGSEYEVEDFKIGFIQEVNYNGQPQHEERGGQIMISLSQLVDDAIYEWATNPFSKKNGTISFETGISNAPLRIEFTEAYCIGFSQVEDSFSGTRTSLVISPLTQNVSLNGITSKN